MPGAQLQGGWGQRGGASAAMASPMASVLLDPRHQPAMGGRSIHGPRQPRGGQGGPDVGIAEEPMDRRAGRHGIDDDEIFESGGDLGESMWETSPAKALSRENSSALQEEPEVGVLGLIYQFQQAHQTQRTKGPL